MECIGRNELRDLAIATRGTITVTASGSLYYPMFIAYLTDPITGEITHKTRKMIRKNFIKWIETVPTTQILTDISSLPGIMTSAYFIGEDRCIRSIDRLRFLYYGKYIELGDDGFDEWLIADKGFNYYFY